MKRYIFHSDIESLQQPIQMQQAYSTGGAVLAFAQSRADPGAIGGAASGELLVVLAEAKECSIARMDSTSTLKSNSLASPQQPSPFTTYEKRQRWNRNHEQVCQLLQCSLTQVVKNVLYFR